MKRFLSLAAAMLLVSIVSLSAQPRRKCGQEQWRDRFRSEKVAFLTSEMNISPEEAEKFWPVYNQIQDEKNAAQKEVMDSYRALELAVAEGKSADELSAALDRYRTAVAKRHEISEGTCDRLKAVLPVEKVAKYYVSEEKFRREQIHKLHRGGPACPAADPAGPGKPDPKRGAL